MSPRSVAPSLRRMLERANPYVATFAEVAVPDVSRVLHRADDQFLASPPLVGTFSPGASAVASPAGALTLASSATTLINQMTTSASQFHFPQSDPSRFFNAAAWQLDPAFSGAVLRKVSAYLEWTLFGVLNDVDVTLDLRHVHRQPGVFQRSANSSDVQTVVEYTFPSLLKEPIRIKARDLLARYGFTGGVPWLVEWDLTDYRIEINPILYAALPGRMGGSGVPVGDEPEILFVIETTQQFQGTFVSWVADTTSSHTIPGVGLVRELHWNRDPNALPALWVPTASGNALTLKVETEQYVASSQAVYALALPALPQAGSQGRVVFGAGVPSGAAAAMELSTAGSGGPWTAVKDGDPLTVRQALYHARVTMTASADARRAPVVSRIGVEYRSTVDVSREATVEPLGQEVSLPFLVPSIGEGQIQVVRTGRRDYRDVGSDLAVAGPDTQLEADLFLGSYHPQVSRADWFRLGRAVVSARQPSGTSEVFSLLSVAKTLKRKIPARIESINSVYVVAAGATTTAVPINTGGGVTLQGTTISGNEYDNAHNYLRVRASAQVNLDPGAIYEIAGNTGTAQLDFAGLPGTFAAGDVIEVHSGKFVQPALQWVNADPADVWLEILTLHLGLSSDRIGLADVGTTGRAGYPPTVVDRAPGDVALQAKCRVTMKLTEAENGDELIDQLSFLMGGATIEVAGQIIFRQIYPLRDAAGRITVAPDPTSVTFDPRDYTGLDTPTGREQRITELACDYGVDQTASALNPTLTVNYADADALAAYTTQDVEGLGTAEVPANIARWCFNSGINGDAGLYLATQCAQQVVLAGSTGLRPWSWTATDAHPELTVGDAVNLITDQYTDFDPARGVAIRGMLSYPLTIIGVQGRRLRGFLQGLAGVAPVKIVGGTGTLQDTNVAATEGPSFDLVPSRGPTDWSLAFTVTADVVALSIDGGTETTPVSPIMVHLDADVHAYRFRVVKNGVENSIPITIPALTVGGSPASLYSAVGVGPYPSADYASTGTTTMRAQWTMSNPPSGVTYDLFFEEQVTATGYASQRVSGVTSPYDFATSQLFKSSGPTTREVRLTVQAIVSGTVVATSQTTTDLYQVF